MRKKLIALMLSFVCIMSVLYSNIDVQAKVIHETDLEDYIMEEMSAANILGMGISIVSADKELYCAAYGTAQKTEADYVLGALSKSFTAAGIMRMSEDGDLSLDDTVSDYLPQYEKVSEVTLQELLYQTSGITAEQKMSDLEVTGKKGEFEDAYANYNLLGEIIEEISGMTYEEYISDNILDPLDMTSTYSLRTGSDVSGDLLTGYRYYFGFPSASKYQYDKEEDWIQIPSGYLISDIKDMGKYLQMYLKEGGDVLSKGSVNTMLYDGVAVPDDSNVSGDIFDGSAKYAMGWMEKEVKGQTLLYHTGRVENFTSFMVLLPEKDLGITMLLNSMDYLVGQKLIQTLEEGIISIELGETPEKIDSKSCLLWHGVIDAIMLIALIAAWMPVFLMSGWTKRRKNRLIYIPGLIVDILIQIVLPTVLLLLLPNIVPTFMVKRFAPDVYYVVAGVIVSLYLGGLIKLITGIILKIMGLKKEENDDAAEVSSEEENKNILNKKEEKTEQRVEVSEENAKEVDKEAEETLKEELAEENKVEAAENKIEDSAKENTGDKKENKKTETSKEKSESEISSEAAPKEEETEDKKKEEEGKAEETQKTEKTVENKAKASARKPSGRKSGKKNRKK